MKKNLCLITILCLSTRVFAASNNVIPNSALREVAAERWQAALVMYQESLRSHPNDVELWLRIAAVYTKLQNPLEAAKALQQAAMLKKTDATLYVNAARSYIAAKQYNDAMKMIDAAISLKPKESYLYFIKAQVAFSSNNQQDVINAYKQILVLVPNDPDALVSLARLASDKGNYPLAEYYFEKYVYLYPKDSDALSEYIRVEIWKGNYKKAESLLNLYKKRHGKNIVYSTELARLYSLNGKPTLSLQIVNDLLIQFPENKDLLSIQQMDDKYLAQIVKSTGSLEGAKAEGAGDMKTAVKYYKSEAKEQPHNFKIWQHIADIEYTLHNPKGIAEADKNAAIAAGNNAGLYYKASQSYAGIKQPHSALEMLEHALAIEPNNIRYLKARAQIAEWMNNVVVAYDSYVRVILLKTYDYEAMLGIGRIYAQHNLLDSASYVYQLIAHHYPTRTTPYLEWINVENWRGNFRRASKVLTMYEKNFGRTRDYWEAKASILSQAGFGDAALKIIDPMVAKEPKNYDLLKYKTIAEFYSNRIMESLATLKEVNKLKPNDPETLGLNNFILTPFKSYITADGYYSSDTTSIRQQKYQVYGRYFFNPLTQFLYNFNANRMTVDDNSIFKTIQGDRSVQYGGGSIGLRKRFNPKWALQGMLGATHINDGFNFLNYNVAADYRHSDHLTMSLGQTYSLYDISPKSVSLHVRQRYNQLQIFAEPYIQRYFYLSAAYSTFSDTNSLWEIIAQPTMGVVRTTKLNLDVGVYTDLFGFQKQLDNGYYSPSFFQYYALIAQAYWKQSENVGYSLVTTWGQQKDETFGGFKFGGDVALKGYFGLYRKWFLIVSAAASNRGSSAIAAPQDTYKIYSINAALTRRF